MIEKCRNSAYFQIRFRGRRYDYQQFVSEAEGIEDMLFWGGWAYACFPQENGRPYARDPTGDLTGLVYLGQLLKVSLENHTLVA